MAKGVAIVTGASQGIGAASAVRLASNFSSIVLVARNETKLAETASLVQKAGAQALAIAADLSTPEAAKTVVTRTIQEFGRIDAVFNNAGAVPPIDLFQMTDEQWDEAAALKLHGARRLTLEAWPHLQAAEGSVLFMAGVAAETPKAANAALAVVNAGVIAIAKAFADRGIGDGVQVNSILPGPVVTERLTTIIEESARANGLSKDDATRQFLQRSGISRYGQPEEVAELVAYLLSPAAHWLTGSAVRIDGGAVKGV